MKENSIEEDIKILEEFKTHGYAMLLMKYEDRNKTNLKIDQAIEHILSDYKRVLKENEELKAKLEYKEYGDLNNVEFEKYINYIVDTRTKELKEENEKLKYKYAEYVKFSIRKIEELMDEEGNK